MTGFENCGSGSKPELGAWLATYSLRCTMVYSTPSKKRGLDGNLKTDWGGCVTIWCIHTAARLSGSASNSNKPGTQLAELNFLIHADALTSGTTHVVLSSASVWRILWCAAFLSGAVLLVAVLHWAGQL